MGPGGELVASGGPRRSPKLHFRGKVSMGASSATTLTGGPASTYAHNMSVTPRGMNVTEAYRLFRDGQLLVNRRYQRKLVWTIIEKERLISSILSDYPIPLILLAERPDVHGAGKLEIVDGMQRMNAIFSFIENGFAFEGKYFDIREFARAAQNAQAALFASAPAEAPRLSPVECANLLDYQLAVTIYPATEEADITDVFGRINSGGRQLSNQERRQAGVVSPLAELVRIVASELRGDASKQVLPLSEMPEISIESGTTSQGYGVKAEETFWCKQGIISTAQLRASEDEEIIADLAASILTKPVPASREYFDELYQSDSEAYKSVEGALAAHGVERLRREMKTVFSVLREVIDAVSEERALLRKTVNPGSGNPIKTAFFALYMAFFEMVVRQERSPDVPGALLKAISGLQGKLEMASHYTTTADRVKNVDLTKGLIERHFVKKEPPALRHGPGLALDLENSLRRSRIETSRYECKQGLLRLSEERTLDVELVARIGETLCGIANLGADTSGYVFIGVADKKADAERIKQLDGVEPHAVGDRYVVGVDREAKILGGSMEAYVAALIGHIKKSALTEPLKTQVLGAIDVVTYKGLTVIRLTVPAQRGLSFVGEDCFTRSGSSTERVVGPKLVAVSKRFS